jgi:serralysin
MAMVVYDEDNNSAVIGDTQDQFFYGLDGNDLLQINFATSRSTVIEGGNGNDILLSSQGADFLYGGNGNDRLELMGGNDYAEGGQGHDLISGDYENSLYPNSGVDTIHGGDGNDALWGGGKGDIIYGDNGDDIIYGDRTTWNLQSKTPGNDRLYGGEGNDTIFGQGGNDVIDGGAGKDLITGGPGKDTLIGGLGADRFIFTKVSDSKPGSADLIYDFRHGQDLISVSQIDARTGSTGNNVGNNKFVFIGSNDFNGVKGELRYEDGFVYADVNGNKVADLFIRIDGAPAAMFANDFIL